jgi:anthranilate synthase component 1
MFMFFDEIVIFDHVDKTVKVVCAARVTGEEDLKDLYERTCRRVDGLVETLRSPVENRLEDIMARGEVSREYDSNFTREAFMNVVERCKEYISAGDIFQVVPSQRLHCRTQAAPFDIYRALRVVNPSPYMFYLKMGGLRLIGASPEVMTRVENRKVTVRPIAGTRKRGGTAEEDAELAEDLLGDPKERAEHIMLVDLGRNDVGRVAKYNTVKLDDVMVIERYSHVMHIVSNVSGELQDGLTALDALKACLPAGTLSGAPKVRAMEIIDEMEPTKRGPYGGAVGYFDFSGNMDTCIAIRTIVMQGEDVYVQAGGGIVADSVPASEYEETLNKARALLRAIQLAEEDSVQ